MTTFSLVLVFALALGSANSQGNGGLPFPIGQLANIPNGIAGFMAQLSNFPQRTVPSTGSAQGGNFISTFLPNLGDGNSPLEAFTSANPFQGLASGGFLQGLAQNNPFQAFTQGIQNLQSMLTRPPSALNAFIPGLNNAGRPSNPNLSPQTLGEAVPQVAPQTPTGTGGNPAQQLFPDYQIPSVPAGLPATPGSDLLTNALSTSEIAEPAPHDAVDLN